MKYRFRDMSIKRKLTGIIMLTCVIVLTLASAFFLMDQIISEPKELVQQLATLAEMIGTNSTAALIFNDPEAAGTTLAALRAERNILRAAIYRKDGTVLVEYFGQAVGVDPRHAKGEGQPQEGADTPKRCTLPAGAHHCCKDCLKLF